MFKNLLKTKNKARFTSLSLVIVIYILLEVLMNTVGISRSFKALLIPCCCYIVAALALNLCVGISGELSLGHAGFMAVGAFTAVVVSGLTKDMNDILRLIISISVGGLAAGIFGLLISIPVLKLEGDYLAIVTLAFGQIIKSLINNIYLGYDKNGVQFSFVTNKLNLDNGRMLISGPMGSTDTDKIASFTAGIILIIFTLTIIYNLIDSKHGRKIMAARDNKIAAEAIGIDITKTKTLAFVISAILTGMAGSLYALNYASLQPNKFDFNTSILILVYVVFGSLGNMTGTIISTCALYLLPEMLRGLADYRMLIYAIVLILLMIISNNDQAKDFFNRIKKGVKHE